MSLRTWLKRVSQQVASSKANRTNRRPTRMLQLERLEDRTTPTVLVKPFFGAETKLSDNGGHLSNVAVYLIFWGSGWQGTNSAEANQIRNAASSVLGSTYLNCLNQYGSDGRAFLNSTAAYDSSNPANPFKSTKAIDDVIQNKIDDGTLPEPDEQPLSNAIYVVVTRPGVLSDSGTNVAGFNTSGRDIDISDIDDIPEVWTKTEYVPGTTNLNIDKFTLVLGHEIGEIMSDYIQGSGFLVKPPQGAPGGSGNQIGDYEGNSYSYRLNNGALVQPLWSAADKAWLVTDGNSQVLSVSAPAGSWTNGGTGPSFNNQYDVTLNMDQSGTRNDYVEVDTINVSSNTILRINWNGELFNFDSGTVANLTINSRGGADTINLISAPANPNITINAFKRGAAENVTVTSNVPVLVQGEAGPITLVNLSTMTVDVTPQNSVYIEENGNAASLTVHNPGKLFIGTGDTYNKIRGSLVFGDRPGMTTDLTFDDSQDGSARSIGLNATFLQGLTVSLFSWNGLNLSRLTVNGGPAGNTVSVFSTPAIATSLNTGAGQDSVNISSTAGPLTVDGVNGRDTVRVSNSGFMQSIRGQVLVANSGNYTALTLDDSSDSTLQNVQMDVGTSLGTIAGLATAKILYANSAISSLTVQSGSGNNTFTINNTALNRFSLGTRTILNTGSGSDVVNVRGTTGELIVQSGGTFNQITVGSTGHKLDSIQGPVTVNAAVGSLTYLDILDNNTASTAPLILNPTSMTRTGIAPLSYSGVANLTIDAAEPIEVNDTNATTATRITSPTVRARGNTGFLGVTLTGPSPTLDIGTTTKTLDSIRREISLTNDSANGTVTLHDSGSSADHLIEFAPQVRRDDASVLSVSFLSRQPSLIYETGAGVNSVLVHNSTQYKALAVVSGPGNTGVTVINPIDHTLTGFNDVVFYGHAGEGFALDDSGSTTSTTYTVNSGTLFGPSTITKGTSRFGFVGVGVVNLTAGSGNDKVKFNGGTPGTFLVFDGADGNNSVVGPNDATDQWEVFGQDTTILVSPNGARSTFTNIGNITAGSGNDILQIDDTGSLSGTLKGGTGTNTLDYQYRTDNVYVNLRTREATGITGNVTQFQRVLGGSGNDIIVGNGANNQLFGGAGRDLLIAGNSPALLQGGLGEDLLIAGTTIYDTNVSALQAILSKWTETTSFATRIADLLTGNGVPTLGGNKVQSNGGGNTLAGDNGLAGEVSDSDLFFASLATDLLLDRDLQNEVVVPL